MHVFVLILTLLCLAASPALAQDNGQGNGYGQGNGNGNGIGNGSGQGNGKANGQENGNGNANARDSGNGGNNGNGKGGGGGTDTSANTDANGTIHYSQDYARDVVNAGRAVSLASLMPELQARSEGSVIDAELLGVQGILVYSVKVLRTDGRVTQEYFYAQSGRFIGSEP
jgi:hypothetical protein